MSTNRARFWRYVIKASNAYQATVTALGITACVLFGLSSVPMPL